MNELQPTAQSARDSIANKEATPPQSHWDQVLAALAPHANELVNKMLDTIKAHNETSLTTTTVLLVAIVISLTGLAALALFLGRDDTAEKVIIAMVSFLGGTALFGGGKK